MKNYFVILKYLSYGSKMKVGIINVASPGQTCFVTIIVVDDNL